MENILKKMVMFIPRRIKKRLLGDIVERVGRIEALGKSLEASQIMLVDQLKLSIEATLGIKFYGQINQDMFAWLYFKGKKDVFFVDIGAYDGKEFNNTLMFEKRGG
ncbi:MAG: hypothetical protein FWG66_03365, partial [Spirochaetes bacterium]|nr:hypothetical protein [Spirochaetota bacterium]